MNKTQIKALKAHPGLNPAYFDGMKARRDVQRYNRDAALWTIQIPKLRVPKQPSKYVPHYGAKEAAKYATEGATAGRLGGAA